MKKSIIAQLTYLSLSILVVSACSKNEESKKTPAQPINVEKMSTAAYKEIRTLTQEEYNKIYSENSKFTDCYNKNEPNKKIINPNYKVGMKTKEKVSWYKIVNGERFSYTQTEESTASKINEKSIAFNVEILQADLIGFTRNLYKTNEYTENCKIKTDESSGYSYEYYNCDQNSPEPTEELMQYLNSKGFNVDDSCEVHSNNDTNLTVFFSEGTYTLENGQKVKAIAQKEQVLRIENCEKSGQRKILETSFRITSYEKLNPSCYSEEVYTKSIGQDPNTNIVLDEYERVILAAPVK